MKQTTILREKGKHLVFVVHKHAATRLHYDFRLQIGNFMPSWAVPKGPSLDPTVKRLAMQVNDHDFDYRNFEGKIPEGAYGAGTVMIWDEGKYIPEIEAEKGKLEPIEDYIEAQKVMKVGLKKGELKFQLFGKKLKGSFALVRTHFMGSKPAWLLIKHKDKYAKVGYDPAKYDISARTERSMKEIGKS